MRLPTVTLRTGLGLTIVLMGLFTIALVFLSEEIYRNHAIENQRAALVDLVELKTDDLLQVLGSNAGRLGLELQHDQSFRAAFKSRDRNALEELLDNRFYQYFVTAGILKLNQLKVYDRDFNLVTGSTVGQPVPAAGSECTSITAAAQSRSGPERLKPVTRLCKSGDQPYLTVLVPIGLRPDGYLQVVTNPFHDLRRLEDELGMPLRLSGTGGETNYLSENWSDETAESTALVVDYPLQSATGEQILSASLLVDMRDFFANLDHTRNMILLIVGMATVITLLLTRLLAEKIVIQPLQSLCAQLRFRDHGRRTHDTTVNQNIISEFAELRELYEVLEEVSLTDPLTGIANRAHFEKRLELLLANSDPEEQHAVCFLDLDRFKIVNDSCGHAAGDKLLRQISELFSETVRSIDLVARIGGDEFAILLEDCPPAQARRIADTFREVVDNYQFLWENQPFNIGVSIGIVPFTPGESHMSDILSAADTACYVAKENGRNRVHYYRPDDRELNQRRSEMRWATRISRALDNDQFELFSQPIYPTIISSSAETMHEILLWMIDEDGTRISPGQFIPAAERFNLMDAIDRWVITTLCKRINQDRTRGHETPTFAVNLSGQSLSDEGFLHFLIDTLDTLNTPTEHLCFEITETAAIVNLRLATRLISILKGMGVRFSLDDFGSGLSSFTYLKNLQVDYVKIDGSFVRGMTTNPVDHKMVRAIYQMALTMDIETIAECVENEETYSMLQDIGVDYVQGYYTGRPKPLDQSDLGGKPPQESGKVIPLHPA